jgi:hypothetical protein
MTELDVRRRQQTLCERVAARPMLLGPDDRIAIARDFDPNTHPVNGLRHPRHGSMCGWYIWSGPELGDDPGLFEPVCYSHLVIDGALWLDYLGLPSGWRFLAAPGYDDVWFDNQLLRI